MNVAATVLFEALSEFFVLLFLCLFNEAAKGLKYLNKHGKICFLGDLEITLLLKLLDNTFTGDVLQYCFFELHNIIVVSKRIISC